MSDIELLGSSFTETLLKLRTNNNSTSEDASDIIERLRKQAQKTSSIVDYDTLTKLIDGEYDISLKEYTNMSTYNTLMSALYGNNSASPFQQYLNNIMGTKDDSLANAKSFIEKMKENGVSNTSAVKLYSALKTYSLVSSFKSYNFISASV